MKLRCKYCLKKIDSRGMLAHLHFRHWQFTWVELVLNSWMQSAEWIERGRPPAFGQRQLLAPSPLTVYSTRPLGRMAKPQPWMRRPKGYDNGQK